MAYDPSRAKELSEILQEEMEEATPQEQMEILLDLPVRDRTNIFLGIFFGDI